MRVFKDLKEWMSFRTTLKAGQSLGLVTTMGNLHRGINHYSCAVRKKMI